MKMKQPIYYEFAYAIMFYIITFNFKKLMKLFSTKSDNLTALN